MCKIGSRYYLNVLHNVIIGSDMKRIILVLVERFTKRYELCRRKTFNGNSFSIRTKYVLLTRLTYYFMANEIWQQWRKCLQNPKLDASTEVAKISI